MTADKGGHCRWGLLCYADVAVSCVPAALYGWSLLSVLVLGYLGFLAYSLHQQSAASIGHVDLVISSVEVRTRQCQRRSALLVLLRFRVVSMWGGQCSVFLASMCTNHSRPFPGVVT